MDLAQKAKDKEMTLLAEESLKPVKFELADQPQITYVIMPIRVHQ